MRPRLQRRGPERIARRHLAMQVKDPVLRRKLTPDYTMGCKRVLLSNDYYPALGRPNVAVVTDGIREVRANAIVTADGIERPVDVIVLGTGFKITDQPATERVRGRDGRLLGDHWNGSPRAHNGSAIPGFPNLFMLLGPNTGLGHNSVVFMIESQIAYVMDCLRQMDERGLAAVEVREEAERAFSAAVDAKMRGTVWMEGGCKSWYLDANGRNSTLWPGTSWSFHQRVRRFDLANYDITPAAPDRTAQEVVIA
jgi:cation diffusion facilitator CzcD-associated flavoprotein CzcO